MVSDVFPLVTSRADLQDILSSGYFRSVAWRFFHTDITNNHLQLILVASYYELEFGNTCVFMETMAQEPEKLKVLVTRVLQSTLNATDSNAGLIGAAFLFLGALVRYDARWLLECSLYSKWSESCLPIYINTYYGTEVARFPGFTKCVLYFCICCAVCEKSLRERVRDLHFLVYFTGIPEEAGHALVRRLGNVLAGLLEPETAANDFVDAQIRFKTAALGPAFDFLTIAFSRLDVSHSQLSLALETLEIAQLQLLAQTKSLMQRKPLIELVLLAVLGPRVPYTRTFDLSQFTEEDLFDILDNTEFSELPVVPLVPYIFQGPNDLIAGEQARLAMKILHQLNFHLFASLDRLTIVDGAREDGVKGKSKYVHRLESVKLSGCVGQLTMKSLAAVGGYVVLLEIGKPADHDERVRVRKFGIYAARVVRVLFSEGKNVLVHGSMAGYEDRFNWVVCLPESVLVESLVKLHEVLDEKCLDFGENSPVHADEVLVPCIDYDTAKKVENVRLLDEKDKFHYGECTFLPGNGPDSLSPREAAVLLEMLSSRISRVDCAPNSAQAIVGKFLEAVSSNFPAERCLVVLPCRVSALPAGSPSGSFVAGSEQCVGDVFLKRKHLLEKVKTLGYFLGLADYAFDASATNALMLYDAHVVPKWKSFLKQLDKSADSIKRYPLAKLSFESENPELMLSAVVDHYLEVKTVFAELQQLLPLDKTDNGEQVQKFLLHSSKYVFADVSLLVHVEGAFDNVVCMCGSPEIAFPIARNPNFKRLVFFSSQVAGIASCVPKQPLLPLKGVRSEIAALTGASSTVESKYNPGMKYCAQQIQVPPSQSRVNVDEARYVVYLFQYMRLLGYEYGRIELVASPYMKVLIEEILEERGISRGERPSDTKTDFSFGWPYVQEESSPADFLIVSSHPGLSMKAYTDAAQCARLGLYFIGAECTAPFKVKLGDFELYAGVLYAQGRDNRSKSDAYVMEGAEHLGEYTEEMTKMRRGK